MQKRFELPEEFNVYGSHSVLEALKLWLTHCEITPDDAIEIDASKVMEIDGTGIQILASLSRSGYQWKLIEASSKFIDACLITGHQDWLASGEMGS